MAEIPDTPSSTCPVCDREFESVSVHTDGVMVNLRENDRYQRVCFRPDECDGEPSLYFYHHAHANGDRSH